MPYELPRSATPLRGNVFDPEGSGYDDASARAAGITPDESGHMPSRVPETGLLLKGTKHETWHKTVEAENVLGNKIVKKGGKERNAKTRPTSRPTRVAPPE